MNEWPWNEDFSKTLEREMDQSPELVEELKHTQDKLMDMMQQNKVEIERLRRRVAGLENVNRFKRVEPVDIYC